MKLSAKQITDFKKTVWDYYRQNGRHSLPWRKTKNPYRILVSEIMLQQTQVSRVIPKYSIFIEKYPTIKSLANSPLSDILSVWSGLGYNRRALALKKLATAIVKKHRNRIPRDPEVLQTLPGIGSATAGAISVFAFNKPLIFIETNIRTVYIHTFLRRKKSVHDNLLYPLIEQTIDRNNPREWYYALMDYGVFIKQQSKNLNSRSVHYSKQSTFNGSVRQIRGAIIRLLIQNGKMTNKKIKNSIEPNNHNIELILEQLQSEGLIRKFGNSFTID